MLLTIIMTLVGIGVPLDPARKLARAIHGYGIQQWVVSVTGNGTYVNAYAYTCEGIDVNLAIRTYADVNEDIVRPKDVSIHLDVQRGDSVAWSRITDDDDKPNEVVDMLDRMIFALSR